MRSISPDFFLLGTPKSGTTWLWECLNYHPEVYCFNELDLHLNLKNAIGQVLNKANLIYNQMHDTTFSEFNYTPHQFTKEDLISITNTLWKNAIERAPKDATVYGEKNPPYTSRVEEMIHTYPNAKYLHIVRDPRDVAYSYYNYIMREIHFYETKNNKNIDSLGIEGPTSKNKDSVMMDAITMWKKDQTTVETIKNRFPEKIYTIRYEDMDAVNLNCVFKFLGVKTSIELADKILQITDVAKRPKSEYSFFTKGRSGGHKECEQDIIDYMNRVLGSWLEMYKYDKQ